MVELQFQLVAGRHFLPHWGWCLAILKLFLFFPLFLMSVCNGLFLNKLISGSLSILHCKMPIMVYVECARQAVQLPGSRMLSAGLCQSHEPKGTKKYNN